MSKIVYKVTNNMFKKYSANIQYNFILSPRVVILRDNKINSLILKRQMIKPWINKICDNNYAFCHDIYTLKQYKFLGGLCQCGYSKNKKFHDCWHRQYKYDMEKYGKSMLVNKWK